MARRFARPYRVTLMTRALQGSIIAHISTSSSACRSWSSAQGHRLGLAAELLARRDRNPDRRHERQSGTGELCASVPDVGTRWDL
jgi:hypothetical protein